MYKRFLREERLRPWRGALRNTLGVYYGKLALCLIARGRRRAGGLLARRAFRLLRRPRNIAALAWNLAGAGTARGEKS